MKKEVLNHKKQSMSRRIGILIHIFLFLIFYYLVVAVLKDSMTFVFVVIMNVIMIFAYSVGIKSIYDMSLSISNATQIILDMSDNTNDKLWDKVRQMSLFKNRKLTQMFDPYIKEMDRLYSKDLDTVNVDIAEYINDDLIEEAAHSAFLNQVSQGMTGLGILGTFVGLAIGLQEFNPSTTETMASTIPSLLEGIKIAFYTSIFGVTLSLTFNFFHKTCLRHMNESIEEFYSAFYSHVVPIPQNDIANQILKYQQSQSNSMRQFAETISIKIAESFQTIAAPTFTQISQTMEGLSDRMAKTQTDGMGEIVNSFIVEMNQSLGGQFEELGKTISDMCNWQNNLVENIQGILDEISNSASNLSKVNAETEKVVLNVHTFTEKLNNFQIGVNQAYECIETQSKMFEQLSEEQVKHIESLRNHEERLTNQLELINENTEKVLNTTSNQAESNIRLTESVIDMMVNASKELQDVCEKFNTDVRLSINKTFEQFDNNLGDIAIHLSGTILQIDETSQNIPRALNAYFDKMRLEYDEYISTVSKIQNETKSMLVDFVNLVEQVIPGENINEKKTQETRRD